MIYLFVKINLHFRNFNNRFENLPQPFDLFSPLHGHMIEAEDKKNCQLTGNFSSNQSEKRSSESWVDNC